MAAVTGTPSLGTKHPSFLSRPGCPDRGQILTGLEARTITAHHGPGHPPIFVVPQWSGCPPAPAFTDTVPTLAHPPWIARCVSSTQHLLLSFSSKGPSCTAFRGQVAPHTGSPRPPSSVWVPWVLSSTRVGSQQTQSRPARVTAPTCLPRLAPFLFHGRTHGSQVPAQDGTSSASP